MKAQPEATWREILPPHRTEIWEGGSGYEGHHAIALPPLEGIVFTLRNRIQEFTPRRPLYFCLNLKRWVTKSSGDLEGKRAFFIHYAINGDVTAKINFSEICRELTKCFLEQSILFIGIVSHEGAHFSGVRAKPPGKEVLMLDVHLNRTDPVASIEIASHPNLDTRRTLLQDKTTFIAIRLCVSR